MIDDRDRKILELLQRDADHPIADLAERVHLSPSACWRRVRRLEEEGYIARRMVVLDRRRMNLPTTVFVIIRTADHSLEWLEAFRRVIAETPEIVETHRLTGDVDYLLKVVLPNVEHWDAVYKSLVSRLRFHDISSYISMEEVKATASLPTSYA